MADNKPTDMAEVAERAKIREEERADLEAAYRNDATRAGERDRAMRALVLVVVVVVSFALPILSAVIGASVRLFLWAGGFR